MFDRFFNSDNVIWSAMGKIFDLFILNLLLVFTSIPLFTIGPALTGFFYALIQMVRDEEDSVTKAFFRSFSKNFRQAVKLGIPVTLVLVFLYIDVSMSRSAGTGIWTFFMVFFFVIFLFCSATALYIFPLLCKFEKSSREILLLAFTLSLRNPLRTLAMILMILLGVWVTHIVPGLLFIIFGLEGMFIASQMVHILEPWLPAVMPLTDDAETYPEEETEELS